MQWPAKHILVHAPNKPDRALPECPMFRLIFAFAVLVLHTVAARSQCDEANAIWATEQDGVRHVLYGSEGLSNGSRVSIEEWRKAKLAWRAQGTVICSVQSICYLVVDNNLKSPDRETEIIMETIDNDGDELADWVVLAALGQ